MAVEDIGARLVIDPGTALTILTELDTRINEVTASLLKMGAAADSSMASVSKEADASVVAAGESAKASKGAGAAAEDAAGAGIIATQKHGEAVDELAAKTKKAETASKSFGKTLEEVGSTGVAKAGAATFAAGIGIAGESIDQYMKYQKSMTQLVSQAGLSAKRLPAIMQGGLNIGKSTGLDFNDIANQLYRIVSATSGLKETNKQILALGKSAADVAVLFNVAPGAPTEQVARLFGSLSNASRSGKLQDTGGSPAGMAALLNAAVGTGDIRGQDLIGALGRGVLQSGEAVHAKLPDILSWLDLSTRLGAQPSTSGTLIAHSLQQIATPSEQGTKAEEMVGIQQGDLQHILSKQGIGPAVQYLMSSFSKFNPVGNYPTTGGAAPGRASAVTQLQDWGMDPKLMAAFESGNMTKSQTADLQQFMLTKIFGGARQEIPILSIAENPQLFAAIENQIKAQANANVYNKDLKTALGTPSQQLEIGMRNIQAYSIELGKDLTPYLVKFVHGIVDAAKFLAANKPLLVGLVGALGVFAAVGTAVWAGGKIAKTITELGKFFKLLGGISDAHLGTSLLSGAKTSPTVVATEENTAAIIRLTEVMGVSDAEGGGYSRFSGISTKPGLAGDIITTGEDSGAGAEELGGGLLAGLGTKIAGLSVGAKLLGGAGLTGLASMLYSSVIQNRLKGVLTGPLGAHSAQVATSTAGDMLTGAGLGATLGSVVPGLGTGVGAAVGAGVGAAVGLRHTVAGKKVAKTVGQWYDFMTSSPLNKDLGNWDENAGNAIEGAWRWLTGSHSGSTKPNPSVHPLQTLANKNLAAAKTMSKLQTQQIVYNQDMANVTSYRKQFGANSPQYAAALKALKGDAAGMFGKDSPLAGVSTHASLAELSGLFTHAEQGQIRHRTLADQKAQEAHANASMKLWTDSLPINGNGLVQTKAAIAASKSGITERKESGLGSDSTTKNMESTLKTQESHLRLLEADSKKLSKTSDVQSQTTKLTDAIKTNNTTSNNLLRGILNELQTLKITVNLPAGGNTKSKAART